MPLYASGISNWTHCFLRFPQSHLSSMVLSSLSWVTETTSQPVPQLISSLSNPFVTQQLMWTSQNHMGSSWWDQAVHSCRTIQCLPWRSSPVALTSVISVHFFSRVGLFVTPGTAACQASYPSPTPGACSDSCSLNWWCHPTILSSVLHFSSCLARYDTGWSLHSPSKSFSFFPAALQPVGKSLGFSGWELNSYPCVLMSWLIALAYIFPDNHSLKLCLLWTGWISHTTTHHTTVVIV